MGEVYEARHARLPGRFAVKVLAARVRAGSPEFRRFRREAEIASTLRHPNLVQVVDFNLMEDGAPYIVMEFLEGTDLADELHRVERMSPDRTASIVGQVAAALAQAHAAGVVHRDLKPQNVFLVPLRGGGKDFVKLVDFGISKVKSAATVTTEPSLMGTPQYMSPEQAHGRTQEVDPRTDQFALAAMSYEMLCGRPAFSGDSVPAILFSVANNEPAPLGVPFLNPDVENVLRRGLAKAKQNRFPSILEFGDALDQALQRSRAAERAPRAGRPAVAPGAPTRVYGTPADEPSTLKPAVSTAGRGLPRNSRRWLLLGAAGAGVVLLAGRAGRETRPTPPPVAVERPGVQVTPVVHSPAAPVAAAPSTTAARPDAGLTPPARPRPVADQRPAPESKRRPERKKERNATRRSPPEEIPFIDKL